MAQSPLFVKVEKLYESDKELKKEDIVQLQEWHRAQPHLPRMTELQLILFLHSCQFSNESTKKCIDSFYTSRTHCPEFFQNRDPRTPENKENLKQIVVSSLPDKTPEGYGITFIRLMDPNPDIYNFNFHVKLLDMVILDRIQRDGCLPGHVIVLDMSNGTLTHMLKVSLTSLKKLIFYLQEAIPFRLKAIHLVNPVSFMDKVLSLVKPLMKKELQDLLRIHTSHASLHASIPKASLPTEVGGTLCSAFDLHVKLGRTLLENAEFFVEDEKHRVDETKRPGKPKNVGELYGIEGTFKKLDID